VATSLYALGSRAGTRGETVLNPAYKGNCFERQVVYGRQHAATWRGSWCRGGFAPPCGEVSATLRRSTVVLLVIWLFRRNKKVTRLAQVCLTGVRGEAKMRAASILLALQWEIT
jgi:hypothetical protein